MQLLFETQHVRDYFKKDAGVITSPKDLLVLHGDLNDPIELK